MARERILGGLDLSARPQEQPEGTSPFAKNGVLDTKGVVQNEQGFNVDPAVIQGECIGVIETDGPAVIFSVDAGVSKIGWYARSTNTYTLIKDDSGFPNDDKWGFDRDYYIVGEFQRNSLNERTIAWTDKKMPPRCMNLDKPTEVTKAKDTLLFLQAQTPSITTSLSSGGILDKGAYFATAKLLKEDGSETGYLTISAPIVVANSTSSPSTDKALVIEIANMDQSYDRIQIAIIHRSNGDYKAITLNEMEVTPGKLTVIYTGENPGVSIGLDEILVPNAVYSRVGTIGQLNDALYIADLEKEPELDMQRYANLVKLRVKSELMNIQELPEEHTTGKKRSLMHQEVYAVYIRYHRTQGTWTRSFHIPGNAPVSADLLAATSAHEAEIGAKVFQTQDTTRNPDYVGCTVDTGIWVNDNETYPDVEAFDSSSIGGPNLRGQKVRHHRMPSLAYCKETFYAGDAEYGRTKLDLLGLEVSNVVIPKEMQDDIDGYEIMIAKRTLANSTVIGQSILLLAGQSKDLKDTQRGYMSTGGNWHADARGDQGDTTHGPYTGSGAVILTGRDRDEASAGDLDATAKPGLRFRLHSFDMLFNKPSVEPTFISPQLKLRINSFNKDFPSGSVIEDGESGGHDRRPVIYMCDYTKGITPTVVPIDKRIRAIKDTRYLQNDIDSGVYNNLMQETCFVGEMKWVGADNAISDNELPLSIDRSTVNLTYWMRDGQKPKFTETYLVNLMDLKTNLYSTFYSQSLVASGTLVPVTQLRSVVYPGDTYLCDYTFHTYGWFNGSNAAGEDDDRPNITSGYKAVHRFVCEAVSNINLRYEVEGNIYSRWYPRTPITAHKDDQGDYIYQLDRTKDPNQFGYSRDLNVLNDFGNYPLYNPYWSETTAMPFRIHRGGKMPRQGKKRSWRTFLPLDYYEAQKNMGRIVKLLGKDDKLLIHHENALMLTQDKARLESGLLSVTLGAGDIFQFEPQEALSAKQGYAGTQHELAAVDTPWGYIFLDAKQGQIFVYKDGVKLINQGLNQFFRQHLRLTENNPFTGNGVTIGYDPEHKRVLLTIKNLKLSSNLANFVPDYSPTPEFIAKLTANSSIVYKDGRFQKFLGVNATAYSCPSNAAPTGINGSTTIPENTANGTVVANTSILFTDTDSLSYTLMSGNEGTAFSLDAKTGSLRVNNSVMLNYEQRQSYALVIRATDKAGQYIDVTYTVNISNVNEAPRVVNYVFEVSENIAIGTNIGQVIGIDPENQVVTYELVATAAPFAVDTATGMITTTASLDADVTKAYEIKVKAMDPEGLFSTSNILVKVADVNEAPVGIDGTAIVYKDNTVAGAVVYTLSYSDPDEGDKLTLEWVNAPTYAAKYTYDSSTKQLKVTKPSELVAGEKHLLVFKVTDQEGLSDEFTITVNVAVATLTFAPQDYVCIGASCGTGYTLSPDSSYCYKFEDTCATPPVSGTPILTEARSFSSYSQFGTAVYDTGYTAGGAGPYTKITSAFWRNIPGNTTDGPLNRCGLWAVDTDGNGDDDPTNTPIGFTVPVNIPATKQYYIAIAGDNRCQVKVNGVTIVNQVVSELVVNHNTVEGSSAYDSQVAFKFWHVYPVQLTAGQSYIEVTGINDGAPGSFGAEIYDATLAQLQAVTSYADFDAGPTAPKLIFSTKDVRGQQLQLGGTVAWTCPDTYSLVQHEAGVTSCGGQEYTCRKIVTVPISNGYTKKWNKVKVMDGTGAQLALLNNVAGQTYMGQAVPYYPNELNSTDCGYVAG